MSRTNSNSIILSSDDRSFLRDIDKGDMPVVVFFHQPGDEACEFNEMVVRTFAQSHTDSAAFLSFDKNANPEITDRFSLPDGPVLMMIRNNTILGYSRAKLTEARMGAWFDDTRAKSDADGVALGDFIGTVAAKQQRQQTQEQKSVRKARRNHYIGAALRVAGGLVMASTMPLPGMGLAGVLIAAYSANRAFSVYADPEKRAPQAPTSMTGKVLRTTMDALTVWSSFPLLAVAFNTMSGMAFAGTMVAAVSMMAHGSMGLGRLIPSRFLIGSLRKDMEDIARRDPTKPLDEFSPAAPQPEFERAPAADHDSGSVEKSPATTQDGFARASTGQQETKTPPQRRATKDPSAPRPQ